MLTPLRAFRGNTQGIVAEFLRSVFSWGKDVERSPLPLLFGGTYSAGTTARRLYPGGADVVAATATGFYPAYRVLHDGRITSIAAWITGAASATTGQTLTFTLWRWTSRDGWKVTTVHTSVATDSTETPGTALARVDVNEGDKLAMEVTYSGATLAAVGLLLGQVILERR